MNLFGRKNNSIRTTPSVNFTSGTEVMASTATASPPAIAFQHGHNKSHQTVSIELTPASASVKTTTTTPGAYHDTMKELQDFRIDDDEDSFDDIEFGEQLANAATTHVEQVRSKKMRTIWVIAGIVFVGVCVGLIGAFVVNADNANGGNAAVSAPSTSTLISSDQTFEFLPTNATSKVNVTYSIISDEGNSTHFHRSGMELLWDAAAEDEAGTSP